MNYLFYNIVTEEYLCIDIDGAYWSSIFNILAISDVDDEYLSHLTNLANTADLISYERNISDVLIVPFVGANVYFGEAIKFEEYLRLN